MTPEAPRSGGVLTEASDTVYSQGACLVQVVFYRTSEGKEGKEIGARKLLSISGTEQRQKRKEEAEFVQMEGRIE